MGGETVAIDFTKKVMNWPERTELIASWIEAGSRVYDVGAGNCLLKKHLPTCHYTHCDMVARNPETIVVDLNKSFPIFDKLYDYVIIAGVLEYIDEPDMLIIYCLTFCKNLIFSYWPGELTQSREHWSNSYNTGEIFQWLINRNLRAQWLGNQVVIQVDGDAK